MKKILHVASFNGNIGDNAHHNGFYSGFEEVFGKCNWVSYEIRKFYKSWSEAKFDYDFANYANKFDALVIGGGNFFEICHDYSVTACTIDIAEHVLEQIKVPIYFNALGFDIYKGASPENCKKFKIFIEQLTKKENVLISFRNDGSIESYKKTYGALDSSICEVPDGGFFVNYNIPHEISLTSRNRLIGINLACDMIDKRLKNKTYETFIAELSRVYSKLVDENGVKLRFFPHITTDIKIIYDLISTFSDRKVKYDIEVMPYLTGQGQEVGYFEFYRECEVVTGMRFHTNVCSFGMNKKTVPLISYPKLRDTYLNLGMTELTIDVNDENFESNYYLKLAESLESRVDNSCQITSLRKWQLDVIEKFKDLTALK